MRMTFDEYDALIDSFKGISLPTYWPSVEQIMAFEEEPEKWIKLALYLMKKGKKPADKEERYRKNTLNLFIRENLELVNQTQESC